MICMATSKRVGESGISGSAGPSSQYNHNMPYELLRGLNSNATITPNFIKEGPSFDFGELEEAIVLQGVKINSNDETKATATLYGSATLEMFPSWPARTSHTPRGRSSRSGGDESGGDSGLNSSFSSRGGDQNQGPADTESSPITINPSFHHLHLSPHHLQQKTADIASDHPHQPAPAPAPAPAAASSNKAVDAKTLRRLAQNREAARKSRLRKKAYVQQLETSRIRLAQLEQELHTVRFLGGGNGMFEMEYGRWVDEEQRHIWELRTALESHLSDGELRLLVEAYIGHYDRMFGLKADAAKSDVFNLLAGTWASPAERCFLWLAGFRPSHLIKMLIGRLEPLTEHQVVGMYGLQQWSHQAEETLTQQLDQLHQSLVETIAMHNMPLALPNLANLQGLVGQADKLRQQTIHQLHRILTVRQAARCFLMIGEYYNRLRALSALWASRPREDQ